MIYAKITRTQKGAIFSWTADSEVAFEYLQSKLLTAPILSCPRTLSQKLMPRQQAGFSGLQN